METIAAVVVGALIGWLAGRDRSRREQDWDRRQVLREKLEEIGGLVDEVDRGFQEFCVKSMQAITLNKPLRADGIRPPYARLTFLVTFYAPELRPSLADIEKAQATMRPEVADALVGDADKQAQGVALASLVTAMGEINSACRALADDAAASGRDRFGLAGDFDEPKGWRRRFAWSRQESGD